MIARSPTPPPEKDMGREHSGKKENQIISDPVLAEVVLWYLLRDPGTIMWSPDKHCHIPHEIYHLKSMRDR